MIPIKTFKELNVHPSCVSLLDYQKITTAMPVQEQAIPHALKGKDVVAIAQTGTGKTLAFGLPSLTRIAKDRSKSIKMLVICPTRELAEQIHTVLKQHASKLNLNTCCVYGGVSINMQAARLQRQPSIVVATPGRLIDHINRGNVNMKKLQILTLDEADRMLDMGFLPDIKKIVATIPSKRQTLLFSATFPTAVQNKVKEFINDPVKIEIAPESTTAENVVQGIYPVIAERKADLLQQLLQQPEVESTLVFTRTKIRADRVRKRLRESGFKAEAIHGDCTQNSRLASIKKLKDGRSNILVATDVAARGIDIKGITHVINYDIPANPEDYVHRIGRTARAQAKGTAYTFASPGEEYLIRSIQKAIGQSIEHHEWEGMATLKPISTSSAPAAKPKRKPRRDRSDNAAASSSKPKRKPRHERPDNAAASSSKPKRKPRHERPDNAAASSSKIKRKPRHERPDNAAASSSKPKRKPRHERPDNTSASSSKPKRKPRHERPHKAASSAPSGNRKWSKKPKKTSKHHSA